MAEHMRLNEIEIVLSDIITFNHEQGVCPLCREKKEAYQELRLATSNGHLCPDIYVHDACIEKEKSPEEAFKLIIDDWRRAREYAHWFPGGNK